MEMKEAIARLEENVQALRQDSSEMKNALTTLTKFMHQNQDLQQDYRAVTNRLRQVERTQSRIMGAAGIVGTLIALVTTLYQIL